MKVYHISHYINGYRQAYRKFMGYTKREAIRLYREEFGLKYKRIDLLVLDSNGNRVN